MASSREPGSVSASSRARNRDGPFWPDRDTSRPLVVIYQNGKLTISARDAPLGDILRVVCEKIGAVLADLPPEADQRIFANLSPGRPREVLSSLLHNTGLDFFVVASVNDPSAVGRVLVLPKDTTPPSPVAQNEVSQPQMASTDDAAVNPQKTDPPTSKAAPEQPAGRPRHRRR